MTRANRAPAPLIVLAMLGMALFAVPLVGLVVQTPWSDLFGLLSGEVVRDALWLSLLSSVGATVIALVLGVPLAWVLARIDFPGKALVRGLVLLPLVLPPTTTEIIFLLAVQK